MTIVSRESKETRIRIGITADSGQVQCSTTDAFLDHMLVTFARYADLGLQIDAEGDLRHHLIEDVAIALGTALSAHLPVSAARYGNRTIPMDDALVQVVIDAGGRPFYKGPLPSSLYDHFFRSVADNARATVHVLVIRGTDRHHIVEAAFKAFGLAWRDAMITTSEIFSTKGSVQLDISQ